jgi:hypothetical protein
MSVYCQRVGGEIEDAANACDNRWQIPEIWKANDCLEAVSLGGFDD